MIRFACPSCEKEVEPEQTPSCRHCGAEVRVMGEIYLASLDSIDLAQLSFIEGRDRDAHDFAHESWALYHDRISASAGLLAAVLLKDPINISRWLRRRKRIMEEP